MTTNGTNPGSFDTGKFHRDKVHLLRALELTQLPVRLRLENFDGPQVDCVIRAVHKGDRIEIVAEGTVAGNNLPASFFVHVNDIIDITMPFVVGQAKVTNPPDVEDVTPSPRRRASSKATTTHPRTRRTTASV